MQRTVTLQLERKQFSDFERIAKEEHRTTENLIEHLMLQTLRHTQQYGYRVRMQAEADRLFEMPPAPSETEE